MVSLTALMGFLLFAAPATLRAPEAATPVPVAEATVAPAYRVTVTAYNAVPEQTDDTPHETASGAYANPEVIAARSQDLAEKLPFGTVIEFDGADISSKHTCGYSVVASRIGYRVIADTMNARYADRIDILFNTKADYATAERGMRNAAEVLGVCVGASIRVVGHIEIRNIPKTQAELAALIGDTNTDLALK